ncbi:MAG: hypothetical protein MJA84_01035 [Firmicutes bacterium]|nr:hypothetical protein [Bacillota bacterium]
MSPELVPWLAALAFLLGLLALLLEIFVFPGFGVAGMIGIILFGWGILLLSTDVAATLRSLVIAAVASLVAFVLGLKLLSRVNFWQRLTLGTRQQKDIGYSAPAEENKRFTGQEGITLTPLRPAGTADIDGERLDVVTEGGFVPINAKVVVVKVEGGRIVVRPL